MKCGIPPKHRSVVARPVWNKGTSYAPREREELGLRGLFPGGAPITLKSKIENTMEQLRSKSSDLDKYIFLHTIQDSDETLYHACIHQHLIELMPFIYTPTVGEACLKWSRIYRQTVRGMYLTLNDRGHLRRIFNNYPEKEIEAIVVTDGEAILGLGDLGVNGMGIPIGKLALYTGCAGIHPSKCLAVHIDVGTNNETLLADPTYPGLKHSRVRGAQFFGLMAEFIEACKDAYGEHVLIQFEDFSSVTAFPLLEQHGTRACCFNDDVQGTAAVVLGGLMSALPLTSLPKISDHTFVFYGAGAAGVGIADLVALAVQRDRPGWSLAQARRRIWLVDSRGLVTADRTFASDKHKRPYAHPMPKGVGSFDSSSLQSIVDTLRPTALIGVSAQAGAFTQDICRLMAELNSRPVIFSLSNPTKLCECTPHDAYAWTEGRCIYSSGSPFGPISLPSGQTFKPGQGNNAYIFPGVGLAAVLSGATCITEDDFFVAASTLAAQVTEDDLAMGAVYPSLGRLREVSVAIAVTVSENMFHTGRATKPLPLSASERYRAGDRALLEACCRAAMYTPSYHEEEEDEDEEEEDPVPFCIRSRL